MSTSHTFLSDMVKSCVDAFLVYMLLLVVTRKRLFRERKTVCIEIEFYYVISNFNFLSIQFYIYIIQQILKAWPNARNISTQHLATLLGTTCCVRLATVLRYVACVWPVHSTHVATSCNNVARCCVEMLRAFGQAFKAQTLEFI